MGVPAFFRWLSRKYPSIVVHCVEEHRQKLEAGIDLPVDTSEANPHGIEFDNLYLDMNGIIHPCTHPENKPAPKNEAEMFVAIFEYIDRIFSIVRPRQVLYMAIDGVAPRAKMNQQRSRRFRAGKESREKKAEIERLRTELTAKGAYLPEKKDSEHFDSNCITPGTPFMARLAVALRYYIHERLNTDPGWRNIKVILSDANVPGEGEHKIMDFIRKQRAQPDHNPDTRHCLCGADADLIMLGLATHEPYFTIIREEFKPNQPRPCELCGQIGHEMKDCVGAPREEEQETVVPVSNSSDGVDFIFIHLNVLREYLRRELKMEHLPFPYDFERALDDWVFMCFFVGNDFLPHLPSLEIRENAIDRLVGIYKQTVLRSGGWITDSGLVSMPRVQLVLQDLGTVEDDIFNKRRNDDLRFKARQKREKRQRQSEGRWVQSSPGFAPTALGAGRAGPGRVDNVRQVASAERNLSNLESAAALKAMLRPDGGPQGSRGGAHVRSNSEPQKRRLDGQGDGADSDDEPPDEVRLWEDGWKERYYQSKFGVEAEDMKEFRVQVAHHYVRGLCWVLRYYYQGCRSWTWYFPYHYAPFASDFVNISDMKMDFLNEETEPFKPLEQLMGVFPADSKSHVPSSWQELMTDPFSPIIDFYPTDFKIDLNGKKYLWQGVALLPFVDEVRLLQALEVVYPDISQEERERNVRGPDRIFCHMKHPLSALMMELYVDGSGKVTDDFANRKTEGCKKTAIVPQLANGLAGKVWCDNRDLCFLPEEVVRSPVTLCEDLANNQAVSACYADPEYERQFIFPAKILPTVTMPPDTLKPEDFPSNQGYRPNMGYGVPQRNRSNYDSGPMNRMVRGSMGRGRGGGGGGGDFRPPRQYGQQYQGQGQAQGQYGYGRQQQQQQQQYGRPPQLMQQPYYQQQRQSNFSVSNQGSWQSGQRDPRQGGVYGQRQGGRGGSYPPPPRNYRGGNSGGGYGGHDSHNYYN